MKRSEELPAPIIMAATLRTALSNHESTKHHYHHYAAALGYMDWDTQPDPFRRFAGAPLSSLRFPPMDGTPPYQDVFLRGAPATCRSVIDAKPLSFETLSDFLFYSLSITAWKQYGESRWSLRVNPSSGNLHPTEGYVVTPALPGLHTQPAVYHYAPKEHGLERRSELSDDIWKSLMEGFPRDPPAQPGEQGEQAQPAQSGEQAQPTSAFLVGLSSIHWRESWKYGERAYRYCQHDAGHALAALRISAAIFGWGFYVLDDVPDDHVELLLGLDRPDGFMPEERECPDMLAVVLPGGPLSGHSRHEKKLPEEAVRAVARGSWTGCANQLSAGHHPWDAIEAVSEACRKKSPMTFPRPHRRGGITTQRVPAATTSESLTAGKIIRQRRSAQAMDGATSLPRNYFYSMMAKLMPITGNIPWDAADWTGFVHLGLFVHRVEGLNPGLYALVRDPNKLDFVRRQMNPEFRWLTPTGCPDGLPLYLLKEVDCRAMAASVSCGQDIAGDGAFSLGMLAEFQPTLEMCGSHFYRNLFWETGMIGQVLYLEAEASGIRSTGIGCFFDDPVHEIFGLRDRGLQSLYHFTVGGAVEDPRLESVPAYAHLDRDPVK